MRETVAACLAQLLEAIKNCESRGNPGWAEAHRSRIVEIARACLPSGAGIDHGCKVDLERSTPEKIVIVLSYHHMNAGGFYDGWSAHNVTVRPSLVYGIVLHVSGRDRNGVKDYLHDVMHSALTSEPSVPCFGEGSAQKGG